MPHALLLISALLLVAVPLLAQENEDCLMCHSDPDLTGERGGKEIPVYVDEEAYGKSAHSDMDCVMCHQDLAGSDMGHEDEVEPVDCAMCHDEQAEQHALSLHGQAAARGDEFAPSCAHCHGKHDIRPHTDPASPTFISNIPLLCGRCHREGSEVSLTHDIPQERILENYSMSMHGAGVFQKGLTVTAVCTSCHTSHQILPHTDRDSSIHEDNIVGTCTKCHAQIEQVHRKVIEGRLWEEEPHKIPVCVDCHSPHKIRRVFYDRGMANEDCLRCHGDLNLTTIRDGKTVSLFVDGPKLLASAHWKVACAQCHSEVSASHERPCETIQSPVNCATCHADPVSQYESGMHGKLAAQGDPDAPVCLDCHDNHATLGKTVPSSPSFPRNVPDLCARCHQAGGKAARRIETHIDDIVQSYGMSIHGKGLHQSGLLVTATCTSCHTAHRELPSADPESSINAANVADTCGNCHHGIEEEFRHSIHWGGSNGTMDPKKPTCEDCHTSHTISRTDQADFRFLMMDQCGRCHEKEAKTFFDTFHGKVSRLGSSGAAKCYDCHGTHNILPTTEPASMLSRQNVVETCGQCHAGSHRRFAGYLTHATHHDQEKYPWLFWTFWGMTALLVGTLTFALLHTLAWLWRLWLTRGEWKRHRAKPGEKVFRRFRKTQRVLHLLMLLSFFTLAITGMALKFSYTGWAQAVSWILGGFESMGYLHRIGAVLLFVVFFVHLYDVFKMRKERKWTWKEILTGPNTILFTWNDARQAWQSIKWFLGRGERPNYGRYTYWEKFDYFAVFWGVFIIGSTGLVLWFPETFTHIVPGWFVNVATIIHSDEALLAVGFIFTVHFFNTHFRPDKFPMDPVIFTGRVPVEELKHDKPAEYEALVKSGKLEEYLHDPFPEPAEKWIRVFGFIALGVGLLLIALIVYAMVFGYK